MNNPIITILSSEKFIGENFVKWKSNMNIVLICRNYKFILTEKCQNLLPTLLVLYKEPTIVRFKPTTKPAITC